jgi:hypothetical protein
MAWFQNITVVLKFLPLLFIGVIGWFFVEKGTTRLLDPDRARKSPPPSEAARIGCSGAPIRVRGRPPDRPASLRTDSLSFVYRLGLVGLLRTDPLPCRLDLPRREMLDLG